MGESPQEREEKMLQQRDYAAQLQAQIHEKQTRSQQNHEQRNTREQEEQQEMTMGVREAVTTQEGVSSLPSSSPRAISKQMTSIPSPLPSPSPRSQGSQQPSISFSVPEIQVTSPVSLSSTFADYPSYQAMVPSTVPVVAVAAFVPMPSSFEGMLSLEGAKAPRMKSRVDEQLEILRHKCAEIEDV